MIKLIFGDSGRHELHVGDLKIPVVVTDTNINSHTYHKLQAIGGGLNQWVRVLSGAVGTDNRVEVEVEFVGSRVARRLPGKRLT